MYQVFETEVLRSDCDDANVYAAGASLCSKYHCRFGHSELAFKYAQACNSAVTTTVMHVQPNIEKKDSPEDWRYREAATLAFSSILEGPSYPSLAGVTNAGLGFLLNATKDPNPMVRQTTAWTLGTIVLMCSP